MEDQESGTCTFSVRGIELIRDVMSEMYPELEWLRQSERVKVIFNRIPRTKDPEKITQIFEQEQRIRESFPALSPCIMPDRVHHTSLLFNEEPGTWFCSLPTPERLLWTPRPQGPQD